MTDYQTELKKELRSRADKYIDTLPEFAKAYFDDLREQNKSERTIEQYAIDINIFFDWLKGTAGFKNKNINAMKASDIFDVLDIRDINEFTKTYSLVKDKSKYTSAAYRARKASSLRSFITYYCNINETNTALGKIISVPKITTKNIVAMDNEAVARLLDAVKDKTGYDKRTLILHNKVELRDYAILMLGLGTGLRVTEITGIDIDDVDFKEASIKISARKGGDQDKVFFGPEVEEALKDYINNCRPTLLLDNKENSLFVSNQGTRLTVRSVEMLTTKYAKKAGLNDNITPHVLRKTFGTSLYLNTGDIYLVADALHHSNIQTTARHYTKQSEEHKRIAAKESSKLFEK